MHPYFNHGESTSEASVDQEMKDQPIQWARVMRATKYRPATVAAAVGAAAAVAVQDGPPEEPAKKKRKVRGLLGLMALPDAAQSAPIGQPTWGPCLCLNALCSDVFQFPLCHFHVVYKTYDNRNEKY